MGSQTVKLLNCNNLYICHHALCHDSGSEE
jgi:hypothetical protein